ncbi:maleylpyruvate isomerase family mycothiol-dependent enzyme [Salinibacterium sp. dk2585]|uniref:maleylpyruvate isomerase N-terminal domain-containing protein n=1 Tax=unclassified Salinibacterium TaxID=2632331 RepID=UPI0011C253AF|nr:MULTISPECIES: maleylpyruvate isomerase N-terminal domain-containing protein [unclassified Salinibacterium]QEE60439.1 maleylpyruvate isomerase family mycothiol-dependent enzyme [Salinibacterium sp. dk2585]TXK55512.1 maleylpyruvate isomerase family mycothiol-dependent enzyme [Salinibacterium sp. dk5596]
MVARVDRVTDPAIQEQLLLARRGQAYFSRLLMRLSDADFEQPSAIGGWSKAHVIAHVGYHARELSMLVQSASDPDEPPLFETDAAFLDQVEYGATLPPFALRNLSDHAAVHLTVEWRDLSDAGWRRTVPAREGLTVEIAATPAMRACENWFRALDLDAGGKLADIPAAVLELARELPAPAIRPYASLTAEH